MMRKLLSFFALLLACNLAVLAQYPLVTVQNIQTVPGGTLAACRDSSTIEGDTVRIHAVVTTDPDSAAFTTLSRGQMWVRSGFGQFSGLDIIQFVDPNITGMSSLEVGDSVELTGVVTEFGPGETELILLDNSQINILSAGANVMPSLASVGDMNDATQANILPLAVALEPQEPVGAATFIHFQDQPVAVLIGARIRQSRFDCNRRKLAHHVTPTLSSLNSRGQCVGVSRFTPTLLPHFAPAACERQRTRGDDFGTIR